MKKSLLIALALLLLPISMVISTGTANAAVETERSLNGRLLTTAELKAAVDTSGTKLTFSSPIDIPDIQSPGLVSSGRIWEARDGSIMFSALLSNSNGSNLPVSRRDEVLSGKFAKDVIGGFFDSNEYVGDFGTVLTENDFTQGFLAKRDGKNFEVVTVSFIRGNVFGIIFCATTGSNDGLEAWSAFGGQTVKLPD